MDISVVELLTPCLIRMMSRYGLMELPGNSSSNCFMGLENSVKEYKLADREPANPVQQFLFRPTPAVEPTHCPGCCQLLHQDGLQQVLLGASPEGDQVHKLTHHNTISNHKLCSKGGIVTCSLQTIYSALVRNFHGHLSAGST